MKRLLLTVGILLCALLILQCSQKSVTSPETDSDTAAVEVTEEKVYPGGGPLPSTMGEEDSGVGGGP